jgi:tetratricopeptide (TPR) repeat protein
MTRLPAVVALLALPITASAAWVEMRSGPFVAYSDAGDDAARLALNHLEQYRDALGKAIGRPDLKTGWPVVVVVTKQKHPATFGMGRDGWTTAWPASGAPPREWFRTLAMRFFEDNLKGHMPSGLEEAIADYYSTLQVKGIRLTLGTPPPPETRTRHWALIHMLTAREDMVLRLRILLTNLANGSEEDAAARNSFQRSFTDLLKDADAYLAAGQFPPIQMSGRPLDPERQFQAMQPFVSRTRLLPGDLLLSQGKSKEAQAAYRSALNERATSSGHEGLGLALLGDNDPEAAKKELEAAAVEEEAGPRGLTELARLETDKEKARALVERAAKIAPTWPEPYIVGADQEPGPVRQAYLLKKACELSPRNVELWKRLAETQALAKQFDESAKSWAAAMRAARSAQERESLLDEQRRAEALRLEAAAEERRRKAQEEKDDIERVRQAELERIRKAEERANAGGTKPGGKVEKWWDGPPTTPITGTLERVDCATGRAKAHVKTSEGKLLLLRIDDPSKVALIGAGEVKLGCGLQKPPRKVKVEYVPKSDARSGTAGEVAVIEFQ